MKNSQTNIHLKEIQLRRVHTRTDSPHLSSWPDEHIQIGQLHHCTCKVKPKFICILSILKNRFCCLLVRHQFLVGTPDNSDCQIHLREAGLKMTKVPRNIACFVKVSHAASWDLTSRSHLSKEIERDGPIVEHVDPRCYETAVDPTNVVGPFRERESRLTK
ncbi:Golgi-body localisation protein domain, partial [Striga asiatica]